MSIEERLRDMGRHQPAELPSQNEWDRFRARGHGRLLRRRVGVALAAAVIVVAGAQGASSLLHHQAAPLPPAGDDKPPVAGTVQVVTAVHQIWYAQGDLLYLDHQLIESPMMSETGRGPAGADRVALMEAALKRALSGPSSVVVETTDPVARTLFPEGARLIGVDLGRLTTVELSGFSDGLSADERDLALAQIAATVLQLEEVDRVTVLENGTPVTNAPLTEASY
ncbi:MAG: GerMN domain-containing protein [Actinomycetota bacterium]